MGEFKAALASRHQNEERRLGYVAMTRARDALLLTGSYWSDGLKPRGPSVFLRELEQAGLIESLPEGTQFDENPLDFGAVTEEWPLDPLGGRRISVERAAAAVSAPGAALRDAGRWAHDLDLLLLERDRAASGALRVPLPARVAASRFKDFVTDPGKVATALRRPMPEKPYRATRLGTQFHSWVEARYGLSAPSDFLDAQPEQLDVDETDGEGMSEDLAALTAIFERSPWASLRPVDVEIEIDLPFDGRVLICKLDAVYVVSSSHDTLPRFQVVDWKTGKAPKDAKDLEEKQLQLALYRLAYSRWKGIPIDQIDAVFYYVAENKVIAPAHLYDEQELLERWRAGVGP
jgi:DNA helicase-2/ATP-dependent DNA helicase PcrA